VRSLVEQKTFGAKLDGKKLYGKNQVKFMVVLVLETES
jgi:hypothetical protein